MPVRNRITRLIAVLGLVVSLALLLLGIGRFFWWKPANYLTITSSKPQVPMVVTGINVLESTAETVTITASASGKTPVFLGVALTSDVQAFVTGQKYLELTGFASSSAFVEKTVLPSTKTPTRSSTPAPSASATKGTTKDTTKDATKDATATGIQALAAPPQKDAADLATLDIWKKTATGNGKASLNWSLSDARWSAVAFTDGTKPAPTLALKWQQQTSSVASWLLSVVGLLGGAIFGVYLVLSLISEKRSHASRHTAMEQARARRIAARVTGTLPEAAPPAVQGRPTRCAPWRRVAGPRRVGIRKLPVSRFPPVSRTVPRLEAVRLRVRAMRARVARERLHRRLRKLPISRGFCRGRPRLVRRKPGSCRESQRGMRTQVSRRLTSRRTKPGQSPRCRLRASRGAPTSKLPAAGGR